MLLLSNNPRSSYHAWFLIALLCFCFCLLYIVCGFIWYLFVWRSCNVFVFLMLILKFV